ncbi:MAG: CpaF family protein [Bacillota bacterium]|nr:CpaF family protein [Bacillota bacterium]
MEAKVKNTSKYSGDMKLKKSPYEAEDIRKMISEIRILLTDSGKTISDETVLEAIEEHIFSGVKSGCCNHRENIALIHRIFLSLRKEMDILQPYIDDTTISEIMVNGKDNVFVERKGKIERLPVSFDSTEDLEELIRRIAAAVRREINELNPIVDARLSDGSRVNAVYKNVALNGPILTIRKFPDKVMTMEDLIENETLSPELATFLAKLVKAGYNCFVCGGTSSGKTTLLNVLSQEIPSWERVVVIEDSAELQIEQVDNIVRMECRSANVQGKGQVDMSQLVKASLRMRPDRIIVGEVRGAETEALLNALNTGHSGSMSTGHANSIDGMLKRLEALYMQAADFPVDAIRSQITEGIDIMIHMSRMRNGSRKIMEIAELNGIEDGRIVLNRIFDHEAGWMGDGLIHKEKLRLAGLEEEEG